MELLEWIDATERVKPETMQRCASSGECGNCGLCCVALPIEGLPIEIVPDEPIRLFNKRLFEVCPHLKVTAQGRSQCGLQDEKKRPELDACRTWKGDYPNKGYTHPTNFELMMRNFWVWVLRRRSPDELEAANNMIEKGLIPNPLSEAFGTLQLIRLLKSVLNTKELPVRLLEFAQLREALQKQDRFSLEFIKWIIRLDIENPIHQQLFNEYFPR